MPVIIDNVDLDCPNKPNCVSSVASAKCRYAKPIRYSIPMADAKRLIVDELKKRPLTEVISETDRYIHATFTTQILRFVDDVEFIFDEKEKLIHFRSKSRVGYYDFGTNRRRMNEFTSKIASSLQASK